MKRSVLVINADDFGLSSATNDTIMRLGDLGAITSTSVLVPAPAAESGMRALAANRPGHAGLPIGIGAHLACVGEDRLLLGRQDIPTLVDRAGFPPASWRQLLLGLSAKRIDPADIQREFCAQILAIRAAGLELDHINTHQHVHLWPEIGRIVSALAVRFDVPAVRVPTSVARSPKGAAIRGMARRLFDTIRSTERSSTIGVPNSFAGLDEAGNWTLDRFSETLRRWSAGQTGLFEIGTHPGAEHDADRERYRWGYAWGDEANMLSAAANQALVTRSGLELGTYGGQRRA